KYDILSLISPDGITYARRTGAVESNGENIRRSPLFGHVKQKPVGSYYARDAIRNIPMYFSFRKLADYPIIATVGSTEADILQRFHERRKREYFFAFITSFLLLVFLLVIFFALAHRRHIMQILRRSETKYRLIFESSRDAILLVQPWGRVEAMNKAASAMFEQTVTNTQTIRFPQLYEKTEPAISCTINDNNCFCIEETETLFQLHSGRRFVGEIASSSFVDGSGHWYTLVLIRDVTERKRIEQKLQNEQKRYQRIMTRQIIIAQEQEREHIGHELHDNVNQILTTVKLYLETAQQKEALHKELINRSVGYLQQCINEIRHLSHRLSAPTLGTRSLVDSLQVLIESVSTIADFDIHLCVEKYKQPVSKELSLAIYRIVQEQLNNVIKHSGATTVTILLSQTESETELRIADNGKGFDPLVRGNGIGLNNIASRVKAFNGKLAVDAGPGMGCRLEVQFPHKEDCEISLSVAKKH
ncbi:MAG TPA: ATP-binding protein, partial [Flavisolibacter sp.]